ncbi:MAG: beta-CASP ribonuclease aCPSF1 [Candidatus Lokiarchaeota archaeon]|nr:beta-CASP ribonuclease aCPSF1 [Candidatus Lokiarchaeota archaeon]MBD3198726.1 beta-CASP ribonuclease aCPSF1 [Candidatus Lokiarchaeota archaeon]
MSYQRELQKIREEIKDYLPDEIQIQKIEFEGPEVAVYSAGNSGDGDSELIGHSDILKELAKKMRKRVVIRWNVDKRMDPADTEKYIKNLVGEEAEISGIEFDHTRGEVIIESGKPGIVIGKKGVNLKEIRANTFWQPRTIRTPPLDSRTIQLIRGMLAKERQTQKDILLRIGKRIHRPVVFKDLTIRMTSLGGFREVGRSCILMQTKDSNILIDCGLNVGNPHDRFPHFDVPEFSIRDLDAVIISHSHLDHCGLVPFLYKYGYRGPTYSTLPTRNLSTMLQLDFVQICEKEGTTPPYSKRDVKTTVLHTIPLSWGKVTDIAPDIKLTLHNSGHILGSSMVHLHFGKGGYNFVYTGDFKFQKTRLLERANIKFPRVESLLVESTYGGPQDRIPSRRESEQELRQIVNATIKRGGKVLIPVLAVGRAQELIIVLEEFISKGMIEQVPVFLDGLISEATAIHTANPDYLSSDLREKILHQGKNPFLSDFFTTVNTHEERLDVQKGGPCIILATSGMLIGGPSVQYLRGLADDENSSLIFVSYQVSGTLGNRIQRGFREFQYVDAKGRTQLVKMNLKVFTLEAFSGHSSRSQISQFLRRIQPRPKLIMTNHGEESKCISLSTMIHKKLRKSTKSPKNLETVLLK